MSAHTGFLIVPTKRSWASKIDQRFSDRIAEAEPLYKRALAIWEKALGPEHPNVVNGLENYAALLRKTGRTTKATEMEARAKAIRAKHTR